MTDTLTDEQILRMEQSASKVVELLRDYLGFTPDEATQVMCRALGRMCWKVGGEAAQDATLRNC